MNTLAEELHNNYGNYGAPSHVEACNLSRLRRKEALGIHLGQTGEDRAARTMGSQSESNAITAAANLHAKLGRQPFHRSIKQKNELASES